MKKKIHINDEAIAGITTYILWDDDEEVLLRLQRYNAWLTEHTESDERGLSIRLFEW